MRLSIIGTNGFLSTSIASYFYAQGYELDLWGLDVPLHQYNSFHKVNLLSDSLLIGDLASSDMIIYTSGAGIQSNLKEDSELIYALNVSVPIHICNELKKNRFKGTFITFGSYFEMGETSEERLLTEDDIISSRCKAPNDYAISKRMLSRFIDSYEHLYTHWHFFIPTIYGEKENINRLIPYTINAIKKGEDLHFTSGNQTRQYIYVEEIPRLLDFAFANGLPSGIYNIKGTDTLTVREIVEKIHILYNKQISNKCFGVTNRADTGMVFLALDGTKLNNFLTFNTTSIIDDIIMKY